VTMLEDGPCWRSKTESRKKTMIIKIFHEKGIRSSIEID